ncbi:MAG: fumarylacetoacetate hydrolase family protein [Kiritimatiellae bacterium]|nr:fumarylacetoacetate hydrolase family protein [Kiritimatiellia bacterium]
MKLVRYQTNGTPEYGILEDDWVYAIEGDVYAGDIGKARAVGGLETIRLLPPCEPKRIVSIGANYASRCTENGLRIPTKPGEGDKFYIDVRALAGPGDLIRLPEQEARVDFSGELAIVMRRVCEHVTAEEASAGILGYTIVHNAWAKGQPPAGVKGKGVRAYETFCPVGPCLVTDLDPASVAWRTRVNGVVRQDSNTSEMLFSAAEMVADISTTYTLRPGDLIQTGTACGVGPMSPGDVVEIEFEGIGVLRNRAVAGGAMEPVGLEKVQYGGRA